MVLEGGYAAVHDAFSPAEAQRFFLDEQHMNAEGYDHLARAILSALDEQALLPAPEGGEPKGVGGP
jgi:lysophospholipase L1-like esterase